MPLDSPDPTNLPIKLDIHDRDKLDAKKPKAFDLADVPKRISSKNRSTDDEVILNALRDAGLKVQKRKSSGESSKISGEQAYHIRN